MRRKLETAVARVFWITGILGIARRLTLARGGRFVLGFHGVSRRFHRDLPGEVQPILQIGEFTRILEWVAERFSFLSPRDFFSGSRAGVLLTFDDGLASNYDVVLPILERFEAPAIFFVATGHVCDPSIPLPFVEEAFTVHGLASNRVPPEVARELFVGMRPEMVVRCAEHPLITIGSHTLSHPRLTDIAEQQLVTELASSREFLEGLTGGVVDLFAYPFGAYDRRVIEAVRRARYRAAFVESSLNLGGGVFEIQRVGLYSASVPYLAAKLSGLHGSPVRARIHG